MGDQVKMLLALAARRAFTGLGVWLASKGLIQGDPSGFVGACMVLAEVTYEGWNRYGTVLVNAQLAKMKGVHPSDNPVVPNSPGMKAGGGIGAIVFAMALASLLVMPALASDVNSPAPKVVMKAPPPSFAYPTKNGWYALIGTQGGGGSANINAPGVNSNSLFTNSAAVYAGIGYAWNVPNSPMFMALEQKVGYVNFNGAAPGLSLTTGPVDFHTRFLIGAPIDQIAAFFPNLGIQMPTFANLPAGFTAASEKYYVSLGAHVSDNSISFGSATNKVWGVAPSLTPAGMLVQLTNGSVADIYSEIRFNGRGLCAGGAQPLVGTGCGRANTEFLAGLDYKFGIYLP